MAVYLKSLPARKYARRKHRRRSLPARARAIYKARCEKCHGRSGRGGMFSGPPLAGSAIVQAEDPASLINAMLCGSDAPEVADVWFLGDDAGLPRACSTMRSSRPSAITCAPAGATTARP